MARLSFLARVVELVDTRDLKSCAVSLYFSRLQQLASASCSYNQCVFLRFFVFLPRIAEASIRR